MSMLFNHCSFQTTVHFAFPLGFWLVSGTVETFGSPQTCMTDRAMHDHVQMVELQFPLERSQRSLEITFHVPHQFLVVMCSIPPPDNYSLIHMKRRFLFRRFCRFYVPPSHVLRWFLLGRLLASFWAFLTGKLAVPGIHFGFGNEAEGDL